ncbi:hypothetical protein AAVH_39199 [Aphelenchoides avenae]|nr:hypothetical protein AAVH_39199 [Aphelenchus avenae]
MSAALFGREENARMTRGCRVGSDAVLCKRSLDLPTETVFSREPIIHFRSERDNSEGFFPKRSETDADESEPSKASTAKDERLMIQERHKRSV